MSTTVNPEIVTLREKVEAHGMELAEMRGSVNQLNKIVGTTARQSVWQLIALIVSLCVAIGGGLAYQTSMIDKRIDQIDKRIEQIDKRFDQSDKNSSDRFEMIEKRIEQSEKNITARFEDLKQEVRAQRK
jgi:F0F1-type ATP synthase membrane subunit b/b'